MLVSVIIPTHNRPERLAVALQSVRTLDFDSRQLEVIVVNDHGSPVDDVVEEAGRYMNVQLIDQPSQSGPSAARNRGLEVARGEFVAFLDDDDVFSPQHLAGTLPLLRDGADLVYVNINIARTRVTGTTIDDAEVFVRLDFPFDRGLLDVTNHFAPSAVVCRSPRSAGAFFDTALSVEEDWDFFLKLAHGHGYRVVHQPQVAIALHRIPGVDSLTTPTSDDIAALKTYEDNWHLICERWPATTERAQQVRRFMPVMYQMAYARLEAGVPLDHHYYERTLQVLYRALGDPQPSPEQVEDELRAALDGR
ncbi:glycosyltransferase family 2 protein [Streptomyces carminius]|uniref:glycosyltransferase family 2 protein n=1 Tax=Streptomyces carminius TaxID=2665496 RepID=UPI0013042F7C|nr:glycosyltransferase family 2 protein [Streptomyces carminius]